MPPTVKQRLNMSSAADVKRSYALRRVHLMAGDGERVATDLLYIDCNFACSLYRVGVKNNLGLRGDLAKLLNRLQHSGFVIRHHYGNQFRVGTQRAAHVVRINQTPAIYRQISYFAA